MKVLELYLLSQIMSSRCEVESEPHRVCFLLICGLGEGEVGHWLDGKLVLVAGGEAAGHLVYLILSSLVQFQVQISVFHQLVSLVASEQSHYEGLLKLYTAPNLLI